MREWLATHLWSLPRWFAAPATIASVVLGAILSGASFLPALLAALCALFAMAFAHSSNTYLDYYWTKLDRGGPSERSVPKVYTSGQQLLATGQLSQYGNLINMLAWGVGSAMPLIWLPRVAFIPWLLIIPMTFWYSWAKTKWHPEIPLGLGFATFSVWLGMAASGQVDYLRGAIWSIPFFLLWGLTAEWIDQWLDGKANWPKGARSLGVWWRIKGWPVEALVTWGFTLSFIAAGFLGALPYWAIPLVFATIVAFPRHVKAGLVVGLGAIFIFMVHFILQVAGFL